jgi:hypothetical protein
MPRSSSIPVLGLLLTLAQPAMAQERYALEPEEGRWIEVQKKAPAPSMFEPDSELRLIGATFLVGVPDGIAPGISFHPWTNFVHLDLSLSGLLSIGVRGGVTLDPFDWVVAPTLTLAAGYNGMAALPFVSAQSIRFETSYINVQLGIEVGRRSRFRIFLRGGYSHLWINTDYRPSYSGGQVTSPTKVQIDLWPSLNLGVTGYL